MKVGDKFKTACGLVTQVYDTLPINTEKMQEQIVYHTLFLAVLVEGSNEHIVAYDPTGQGYCAKSLVLGSVVPFPVDDPFNITGKYVEPDVRYFLRGVDGFYFGPDCAPVSYSDLNAAQYKNQELGNIFSIVRFIETEGVRD